MEFVRLPSFEKTAADLFSEADIFELEMLLVAQPDAGDLIPGGRGLRKLRRPAKGHGKRGGARVIYYHVTQQHVILLIVAYAKNEQEDLDRKQLQILSTLIKSEFP
ncbi:MAG: type II toxin-antitoxin system RelE/ParE family toxin [Verrucomicrobia bacterium]|nr:type II toxin-antitoxin system RelE/ParE family toxin [Verrucomicrobiota bacterium]